MKNRNNDPIEVQRALHLLEIHYRSFYDAASLARDTGHPVPVDTRAWSQILASVLSGVKGIARHKGADLDDGSDVKGAITWEAIDTPRFNGVIKAGTKASTAGKIESLDSVPYLYLVLWDNNPANNKPRCRVWCVRPQHDKLFRGMCRKWYAARKKGEIESTNFQLHPPRNLNTNVIRNSYGVFEYPLFFCAEYAGGKYDLVSFDVSVMKNGLCRRVKAMNRDL